MLPRIVASCYPYGSFPMTRGWAEKQRLGDLPAYAKAEGSDIQQFASFDEEAQNAPRGTVRRPRFGRQRTVAGSQKVAPKSSAAVAEAEKRVGSHRNKEFDSTITDLKILAQSGALSLAADSGGRQLPPLRAERKIPALDDAIAQERSAIEAWRQLVAAAGDLYSDDLMMGVRGATCAATGKTNWRRWKRAGRP